ncbi:MAG: molybdenum cofactor biosynthesis protein MoaE, partial [Thermaurantiacus sp.]
MFEVRIQPQPFDLAAEHARLAGHSPEIGAVVAFTGQVRATPLELEHWPGMAERQMRHLLDEACARWPLAGAIVVHRFGRLEVGEPIVLVATASAHRAPAFAAAEFLMDWLKTRAPFWKRE